MNTMADPAPPPSGPLRLFIGATPKTGNIWLKHVLAAAYAIPVMEIGDHVDDDVLAGLGERWVVHQHLAPAGPMLACLKRHGVAVLTVFRHPGDVLLSLKAYLGGLGDGVERDGEAAMMAGEGGETGGAKMLDYVRTAFPTQINLSLLWARVGAIPVRYEDMVADPVATLRLLAPHLGAVPESRMRAAVALANLARMRRRHAGAANHFRKGRPGEWARALAPEVVEVFRTLPPYPAQFEALGYTLDPQVEEARPRAAAETVYPFEGAACFDNGVPIADVLVEILFVARGDDPGRWPHPARAEGGDSYFAWLNAPCAHDPCRGGAVPLVTNLAWNLHQARPDLRRAYPDPFGADRLGFVNWFLIFAMKEFGLDLAFTAPVLESIAKAGRFDV